MKHAPFDKKRADRADVAARLLRMADLMGLSPSDVLDGSDQSLEILALCCNCAASEKCDRFMDGASRFDLEDCPNINTYRRLAAMKA